MAASGPVVLVNESLLTSPPPGKKNCRCALGERERERTECVAFGLDLLVDPPVLLFQGRTGFEHVHTQIGRPKENILLLKGCAIQESGEMSIYCEWHHSIYFC